ncbi:hypothetical protein ACR8G9_22700 [Salmonella enterica subsp. enterica serovar Paratyphi A]
MADTVKQKGQEAKDQAFQTAQNVKDQTTGAKDQTGSYASDKAGAAKDKAGEVAQSTKGSTIAGKDKTTGVIGNATETVKNAAAGATETVKNAAVGATEAVKNTFGMGNKGGNK